MTGDGLPRWAWVSGEPCVQGLIRTTLEDFRVTELPLIEPEGDGVHLWLEIEKRGANTQWVSAQLAKAAGVHPKEVGYAGMKDRNGVTRQWFSVGMQEARQPDPQAWAIDGVQVLQARRHTRKLKRGALRGNRFRLVVRELQGDSGSLDERLKRVAEQGIPNYFGPQRFGHGGGNIGRARQWLLHGGRIRRDRRSLYLSAARSFLFNQVLSARIEAGSWNRLLDGELAQLAGSRSVFACELPDETLHRRCREFDIHPTGPLPGDGGQQPGGAALQLECAVLESEEGITEALRRLRVEASRRALRVRPEGLAWKLDGTELVLEFTLPAGAYATSFLREVVNVHPEPISGVL